MQLEKIDITKLGTLTVDWWRWALDNPEVLDDLSGDSAHVGQPEDVFFLAGIWADKGIQQVPIRKVIIPYGKEIVFPIINCEADSILYPWLKTDEDLIKHVEEQENTIIRKEVYLDNIPLETYRTKSDPLVFSIMIDGQQTRASADGFYCILQPERGKHTLRFGGECMMGKLKTDVVYELEIK